MFLREAMRSAIFADMPDYASAAHRRQFSFSRYYASIVFFLRHYRADAFHFRRHLAAYYFRFRFDDAAHFPIADIFRQLLMPSPADAADARFLSFAAITASRLSFATIFSLRRCPLIFSIFRDADAATASSIR
jgi:hypothetical protein